MWNDFYELCALDKALFHAKFDENESDSYLIWQSFSCCHDKTRVEAKNAVIQERESHNYEVMRQWWHLMENRPEYRMIQRRIENDEDWPERTLERKRKLEDLGSPFSVDDALIDALLEWGENNNRYFHSTD